MTAAGLVRRAEVVRTPSFTVVVEIRPPAPSGPSAVSVLDPALLAVVQRLLRSIPDHHREPRPPAPNPVLAALVYAEAHYAEPLTVGDLARHVALSRSAFSAQFRELTGRAPYGFLKELRLDRARDLLADGGPSVASVARRVGYTSVSHFIKEFRTRFGATPRAYAALRARPAPAG